jgi:hypothetical protein
MTGFWTDDYWGPHTPGPDCPCEPKLVEYDVPGLPPDHGLYTQTVVLGLRHRGVTEETARYENPNVPENQA